MGTLGTTIGTWIDSAATEVKENIVEPGLNTLESIIKLPGQLASGAGSTFDAVKMLPWIIGLVLVAALFFIFKNPGIVKAFL